MDTKTSGTIALIALILVILVILYLFLGRLIGNMFPNSKANRFFGGTTPTRACDIITYDLLNIHNTKSGEERYNALYNYMQTLTQNNGGDILYAIVQMVDIINNNVNNVIDINYIFDVLNAAGEATIIDPQSEMAVGIRAAINNSSDGRIDIPERFITAINHLINGRPARSNAQVQGPVPRRNNAQGPTLHRTDDERSRFQ